MRFGRRSEGVKSLRGIFFKARRDRWIPWEVYEASGLSFFFLSFSFSFLFYYPILGIIILITII